MPSSSEAKSTMVDGVRPGVEPPSRYTETLSPSWASASSTDVAGSLPVMLAELTPSGPVRRSSSRVAS